MDRALVAVLLVSTLSVLISSHQICYIGSEYQPQSGIQPRWFLPYKDPCKCTAVRLGGTSIPVPSCVEGALYYLDMLFLTENPGEIQAFFKCQAACLNPGPLGLENGTIPDDSISASGSLTLYPARDGRLNNDGRWATDSSTGSWIEVDFRNSTVVSGVITQGSPKFDNRVTSYKVRYQTELSPSSTYQYVTDGNGHVKVFDGNIDDPLSAVKNAFHESFVATKVRIEPIGYVGVIVLRFELLGCRVN